MDDKIIADAFSAWFSSPTPIRELQADAMEYLIILGEESSDYDDVVDSISFRAGYKAALSTIDPDAIRAEARAETDRLIEALTPSAKTKGAYIGEFSFPVHDTDEDGEEVLRQITVPWTTVKEIMAAIRKRAAILADDPKERETEGPQVGDVVAYVFADGTVTLDKWDGTRQYNGNLVVLMRRAEVERKLKEAGE